MEQERILRRLSKRIHDIENKLERVTKTLGLCMAAVCASVLLSYSENSSRLSTETRSMLENLVLLLAFGSGAGGAVSFTTHAKQTEQDKDDEDS